MILNLLIGLLQLAPQELPIPQVINTQDGLSNNIVYETYQDSKGFIWIATDNGLNRFDGYEFKIFYHNAKDSTSISSNTVRSILEDHNGNLWIGTFDGLNLYHRETDSFTLFKHLQNIPNARLDIQHMMLDSRGRIWFNTLRTIGWFDTQSFEFGFIDPSYSASTMAVSNVNGVWVSSTDGTIEKFIIEDKKLKTLKKTRVMDRLPLYWGNYSKSLWIKDLSFKEAFDVKTSVLPKLPNDVFAREILEIDENTLWIGTEIGLFIYHTVKGQLDRINLGNSSTLSSAIRSIYKDKNGGIWVGTLGGLFHFDSFQKPFKHINIINGSGDVIMGLESSTQSIYANALGNGLYEYDIESQQTKEKYFAKKPPVGFNFIWAIKDVPKSNYPLWLATDAGLILYNPRNSNWKNINPPFSPNMTRPSFSIGETKNDFIWVSSQEGILLLSKKNGEIIKSISLAEFTKESIIQDLAEFDDQLYIATEGVGVLVYNIKSEQVQLLSDIAPQSKNISSTPIWELYKDDQILWIGTNRGLFQLDIETYEFKQIQADSNLENRVIFSIEKDQNGTLWMGTERGLVSYNHQNREVHYYTENDGLENIEYNRKSVKKTLDGTLLFGGVNGITAFDPNQIQQNTIIPPIHITAIKVITSDSTFIPSFEKTDKLVLPWQQNTIQIDYVALNFTNPTQNQYRHQLVGHDPDWVLGEGLRQARYVRLPPGEYKFEVMGSNNDGLWNPKSESITIEILPPFWQTWWFKALVVIIIATMLWALYKYRVNRLLEVERMKLRIAGDLHDEVGSGLSGIALTGDLLQRQVKNGGAKPELVDRITKNARNLASSLDAIVWLIDPQKETLGDFLIKTRAVGSELLTQSKFEMVEKLSEFDRERILSAEQKRNLFLLTKEGLHNISKHAQADRVTLSFEYNHSKLFLKLTDDGNGFNLQENEKGHGLDSIRNRAELLKAELEVHSSIGRGTQISLNMKLP